MRARVEARSTIQAENVNHCLYESRLPKQTADSLKARACFLFSPSPHSTSVELPLEIPCMGLGPGPSAPLRPAVVRGWMRGG